MSIPPLFKQGVSAKVRASLFALIAIVILIIDARTHALTTLRQAISATLYPFQIVALIPSHIINKINYYIHSLNALQKENYFLRKQQTLNAQLLQQERQITAENTRLRTLLNMQERIKNESIVAEIIYDIHDFFTHKIILNRGLKHGVIQGQPVIDDVGVIGQVTRVLPFTAEVTLLTDKNQAIPIQILRNGLRGVAYGCGYLGTLDLRFIAANADIKKNDILITSGIDGLYPAGLSVAIVLQIKIKSSEIFAHIVCLPFASLNCYKQLLILLVKQNFLMSKN